MSLAISRAKYTGDPGLFGDIFRGLGRAATSLVPGGSAISAALFPRQPATPTAGPGGVRFDLATPGQKAGMLGLSGGARTAFMNLPTSRQLSYNPGQIPIPGPIGMVQRAIPGGATGYTNGGMGGAPMSGYHLNKSDYFLKSGEYIPAGTRWVKNRKRNPANARATSRAISRVTSAKKYAQSLGRISIRKRKSC